MGLAHRIIADQDRGHQEGTLAYEVQLRVPLKQASFAKTVPGKSTQVKRERLRHTKLKKNSSYGVP